MDIAAEHFLDDIFEPVLSREGPGAILLDGAHGPFSDSTQEKIWRLARDLKFIHGVLETVPGMNNLMVVFDPVVVEDFVIETAMRDFWDLPVTAGASGTVHDVPVFYGGARGEDLEAFAATKSMRVSEIIERHTRPLYSVAAVGAMPGFVYLSGLDPVLAAPRLSNPRQGVPKGSIIIGGSQAGIMPVTAPSGWHILGHTPLDLFDPYRARPALFRPGDRIRFVAEVQA
jgi:KipI family sensor histidine kinase inhibitor